MIYYNGCGCLKTEFFFFFILGAVFLFWGLLTHSFNKYLSQRLCGSRSLQDPILWRGYCSATNTGCVCSPRRGDSALLGPGAACAILRQFRSLRHHVGHRREKRDGHRAPRTQVRLCSRGVLHSRLLTRPYKGTRQDAGGPSHQKVHDRNTVTAYLTLCVYKGCF